MLVMSMDTASIPYNPAATALANRIETMLRSPAMTALLGFQVALVLVGWVGVVGALLSPIPRRGEMFVLVFIALTMLALASGPEAYARYRTPAIPFLVIAAGARWVCKPNARPVVATENSIGTVA